MAALGAAGTEGGRGTEGGGGRTFWARCWVLATVGGTTGGPRTSAGGPGAAAGASTASLGGGGRRDGRAGRWIILGMVRFYGWTASQRPVGQWRACGPPVAGPAPPGPSTHICRATTGRIWSAGRQRWSSLGRSPGRSNPAEMLGDHGERAAKNVEPCQNLSGRGGIYKCGLRWSVSRRLATYPY